MASSKEDGAVAAADQLGAMSLGEERKGEPENTVDAEENKEAPTKVCSACGEKSNTLKKCNGCKCVWYCDKECQNKHRKEHKKECRPIKKILDQRGGKLDLGEELDIGPLGKLPPREECPICMRALPLHLGLQSYAFCCGKTICGACNFENQTKRAVVPTCPFCRTSLPTSDVEGLVQAHKRVELKDPSALHTMAMYYDSGLRGLPVDRAKCIDLLRESAGLGNPEALYQLGQTYFYGEMGLEENEEEAVKYWKKAAEGGCIRAWHQLGCAEQDGDYVASFHDWRLAASGGHRRSMEPLIAYFEDGLLRHGDLAETMQLMYRSRAEMRCELTGEVRNRYIEHLKMSGEYDELISYK